MPAGPRRWFAARPRSAPAAEPARSATRTPSSRTATASTRTTIERVPDAEDGPVHRQLIRATLPRIEGQKEERRPDRLHDPPGRRAWQQRLAISFAVAAAATIGCDPAAAAGLAAVRHRAATGHRGNGHRPPGGPAVCRRPLRVRGRVRSGAGSRTGRRLQIGPAATPRWRRQEAFPVARPHLFCFSSVLSSGAVFECPPTCREGSCRAFSSHRSRCCCCQASRPGWHRRSRHRPSVVLGLPLQ